MKRRSWTDQDLAALKEYYPAFGSSRMGKMLNRHPHNVWAKAREMGLKTLREAGYRSPNFNGQGEITGQFMSNARTGAKRRGYTFALTVSFVHELWEKQNKRCYYSAREIGFKDKTASIDRLDSTLSYTTDNVVLVHKLVNKMKLGRTHEEFIRLVHQIVNYQRNYA